VEGIENAEKFYHQGQGGFFLTCHLGNWEILVGSGASSGIPADIIVKRAKSPWFQKFLEDYRNRLGVGVLWESGTAKDILRALSRGRFVGFIFDQFMGPPIGLPVKFMGRLAGTPVSLALLTEKRQVPILPAYSYRDKEGRLHTVIEPAIQLPPLSEDKETRLYQKSQFFNDVIEERVRRHPEQWLWLHRRWKEYRGEPRWKLPMMSVFLFAFLLGLSGCTTPGETQTGIALPADPKIATPEFKQEPEMAEPVEFAENQKVMEEKPKAKSKKKMVKVEKKEIIKDTKESSKSASISATPN
jgi:hypothetical protein